jgi:hypothetical protein
MAACRKAPFEIDYTGDRIAFAVSSPAL